MKDIQFVKASGFLKSLPILKENNPQLSHLELKEIQAILNKSGIAPINDVLYDFVNSNKKVQILYGGRGGGKTGSVARKLIKNCRNDKYFKCYYGRQTKDQGRDGVHSMIVSVIEELGLESEFSYSTERTGTTTIKHIESGNSFIQFSGDNPDKIKGIHDPTHLWFDEFDQFSEQFYKKALPTLRTTKASTHLIGTLNNFDITTEHWIAKIFFPELYTGKTKLDYETFTPDQIDKFLVNFTDNYFIDREEYYNTLRSSAGGDSVLLEGMTKGSWGVNRLGNEYYHAFKTALHTKRIIRNNNLADHISVDFNVMPYMPMVCCQIEQTSTEFNFNFYKEYTLPPPQNSIEAICKSYVRDYGEELKNVLYYGDAQGSRRIEGLGDGYTRFDEVRKGLSKFISNSSNRTTRRNQGVLKRRDLMNKIFNGDLKYGTLKINIFFDENMTETIKDFRDLQLGVDGKLKKIVRDERGNSYQELGHTSDAVEYLVCFILEKYL